jgi:hypothetical protein
VERLRALNTAGRCKGWKRQAQEQLDIYSKKRPKKQKPEHGPLLSNLAASRDSWRRYAVYGTDREGEEDGDLGEEEMNLLEALNTRLENGLQTEATSRAFVNSLERPKKTLHHSKACCKDLVFWF